MPHFPVTQATSAVSIQDGAIVSKDIHRDDQFNVTVFGTTHARPQSGLAVEHGRARQYAS